MQLVLILSMSLFYIQLCHKDLPHDLKTQKDYSDNITEIGSHSLDHDDGVFFSVNKDLTV
jgi:hypothetical protein